MRSFFHPTPLPHRGHKIRSNMVKDPVCRMVLDESKAAFSTEYKGERNYFCGAGCKERFEKEPEKFLSGKQVDWIKNE